MFSDIFLKKKTWEEGKFKKKKIKLFFLVLGLIHINIIGNFFFEKQNCVFLLFLVLGLIFIEKA